MSKNRRIANIHELREMKSNLLVERLELERKMNEDWVKLKEEFSVRNLIKQAIVSSCKIDNEKTNGLNETIGGIIMKAGNKLIVEAGRKLFKWKN